LVERCACLGFRIDPAKNNARSQHTVYDIGHEDANKKVLVCKTDEEFEMARVTAMNMELFVSPLLR
jgi:acetate kinase